MEDHYHAHYQRANVDKVAGSLEDDGVCSLDGSGETFRFYSPAGDGVVLVPIGADQSAQGHGDDFAQRLEAAERHGNCGGSGLRVLFWRSVALVRSREIQEKSAKERGCTWLLHRSSLSYSNRERACLDGGDSGAVSGCSGDDAPVRMARMIADCPEMRCLFM